MSEQIVCGFCGIDISKKRSGSKFCTLTCANRYFNEKRKISGCTDEHKRKVSESKKGKPLSDAHRLALSVATKAAFQKYGRRRYTDEEKQKRSEERKQYLAEHPESHPNRLCAGRKSYPQRRLLDALACIYDNVGDEVYCDGYWIDILLEDKVAIEVDGEYFHKDRKSQDKIRDEVISRKYRVLRVPAKRVLYSLPEVISEVVAYMGL